MNFSTARFWQSCSNNFNPLRGRVKLQLGTIQRFHLDSSEARQRWNNKHDSSVLDQSFWCRIKSIYCHIRSYYAQAVYSVTDNDIRIKVTLVRSASTLIIDEEILPAKFIQLYSLMAEYWAGCLFCSAVREGLSLWQQNCRATTV